ncbi:MAG: hypothetical protein Q3962_05250 [Corynebacterium sp.]|nr:hypothetical protein [Corynebacterium sp.]
MSYGKRSVHQLLSTMLVSTSLAVGGVAVPAIAPSASALLGQAFAGVQSGGANSVFTWDADKSAWVAHDGGTYSEDMSIAPGGAFPGPGEETDPRTDTQIWNKATVSRSLNRTVEAVITDASGTKKKYASAGDTISWTISYFSERPGKSVQNLLIPIQFADGTTPDDVAIHVQDDESSVDFPAGAIAYYNPADTSINAPVAQAFTNPSFTSPFEFTPSGTTSTAMMGDNVVAANMIGGSTLSPEITKGVNYTNTLWINTEDYLGGSVNLSIEVTFTSKVGAATQATTVLKDEDYKVLSAKGTIFGDLVLDGSNRSTLGAARNALSAPVSDTNPNVWTDYRQGAFATGGSSYSPWARATGDNPIIANQATNLSVINKLGTVDASKYATGMTVNFDVYAVNTSKYAMTAADAAANPSKTYVSDMKQLKALAETDKDNIFKIESADGNNTQSLTNAPYGEWSYFASANNMAIFPATSSAGTKTTLMDTIDDNHPNAIRTLTIDNYPVLGEYSSQFNRLFSAKYLTDAQKQYYINLLNNATTIDDAKKLTDNALAVDQSMGANNIDTAKYEDANGASQDAATVTVSDDDKAAAKAAIDVILKDAGTTKTADDFKNEISSATTAKQIAQIIRNAFKEPQVEAVNNTKNLTPAQKQYYTELLAKDSTRADADNRVNETQDSGYETVSANTVANGAVAEDVPMKETTPEAARNADTTTVANEYDKSAAISALNKEFGDLSDVQERITGVNNATTLGQVAEQLKLAAQTKFNETKSSSYDSILKLNNLTPAQRRSYLEQLGKASTSDEVSSLVKHATEVNAGMDPSTGSTASTNTDTITDADITAAKNYIEHLGLPDTSTYTTGLTAGTTTISELISAVNKAREDAKTAIENNDTLRDEQKTVYKNAVDKVSGPDVDTTNFPDTVKTAIANDPTVNTPVTDASSVNDSMKTNEYSANTESASQTDKDAGTSAIQKLIDDYAGNNETLKTELQTRLDNAKSATTKGDVAKAVDEAMDKVLEAKKQEAADKIMKLENLTPAQKYSYINNINKITLDPVNDNGVVTAPSLEEQIAKVTTQTDGATQVNNAMSSNPTGDPSSQTATDEDKDAATNYISHIGLLNSTTLTDLLNRVTSAGTKADIAKVISDAKTEAAKELDDRGPNGTDDNLKGSLTQAQVDTYKSQINKITGTEIPSNVEQPTLVNDIIKGAANVGTAQKADDASTSIESATTVDKTAADAGIDSLAKEGNTDPILSKYGLTPEQVTQYKGEYSGDHSTQGTVGKAVADAEKQILENAKTAAREDLAKLTSLTPAQRIEYAHRIENSTTPEQVDALRTGFNNVGNEMANGSTDSTTPATADDIAAAKRYITATGVSNADELNNQLTSDVTVGKLVSLVEQARKGAKDEIAKMQDGNTNGYLTPDQVTAYQNAVDKATGVETDGTSGETGTEVVNNVVGNASHMNTGMKEDDPRTSTYHADNGTTADREGARETLNSLKDYLDPANYQTRLDKVSDASKTPSLGEIAKELKDAQKEAEANKLTKAKEDAKTAISNLKYVTPEQKQSYLDQVDKATTVDGVNEIVESSTSVDSTMGGTPDKNAGKDKEPQDTTAATTGISAMPALTPDDLKEFNDGRVNGTDKTREDVGKTVLDAKARVVQRVEEYLENNAPNLTTEQRESYLEQIKKVTDPNDQYETAVSIWNSSHNIDTSMGGNTPEQNPSGTDEDREAANTAIDSFNFIPEDKRNEYKQQIASAPDQKTIGEIVKKAFDEDKTNAKAEIDKLTNLTEDQKTEYKNKVDEAKGGKEVNVPYLEANKEDAKASVDKLKNLTDEEKTEKKQEIDNATTVTAVTTVVTGAVATNKERFDDALKKAQETLDRAKAEYDKIRYTNATPEIKKAFEDRIAELTNLIGSANEVNGVDTVAASELTTADSNTTVAQNALDGTASDTGSKFNWVPIALGGLGVIGLGGLAWFLLGNHDNNQQQATADAANGAAAGNGAANGANAGANGAANGANGVANGDVAGNAQNGAADASANTAGNGAANGQQAPVARAVGRLASTGAAVSGVALLAAVLIAVGGVFAFRRRKSED